MITTNEAKTKMYRYEMIHRPLSIGCQPKGFVDYDDSIGRHGVVSYDRALTDEELYEYELREWKD